MKLATASKFYEVKKLSSVQLEDDKIIVPAITHHIIIIDRSGSMYSDMERVKSGILHMLENFSDPSLKLSLISYSSDGDVSLHFSKVLYQDVLNRKEYKAEVSKIRATCYTGISQSIDLAFSITDETEGTCITLHTDGWANDPSAYDEEVRITQLVNRFRVERPNAFINTIAYHKYADLNLLKKIANTTNGRNVVVENEAEFKEELSQITSKCLETVGKSDEPKVLVKAAKGEYKIAYNGSEIKACSNNQFQMDFTDDLSVYVYRPISAQEYQSLPEEYPSSNEKLMFARTLYQLGNLFEARNVLKDAGHRGLYARFKNALELKDILTAIDHIDAILFGRTPKYQLEVVFGQKPHCSLFELLDQFKKHQAEMDLQHVLKTYKKRSVRRLQGTRNENNEFIPCRYKTQSTSREWKKISNYSVNRTSAALNLEVIDDTHLIDSTNNTVIHEVAGIPIQLKEFRTYAVINDEYCIKNMIVRIQSSQKDEFESKTGLKADWTEGEYALYEINIKDTPLATKELSFNDQVSKKLIELAVINKFISAALKESNVSPYTEEQIATLKEYYLTPSLNFSPPTVNPYVDLKDAVSDGSIDSYTSKKVNFGSVEYGILGTGKLHSGNAYLQRRFTYGDVEKPTLDLLMSPDFNKELLGIKTLSARVKLDKIDEFTYPIYEELLGFKPLQKINSILGPVLAKKVLNALEHKNIDALATVQQDVEDHMSYFYDETITPLIFAVGIAGSIDELELGFENYTADELETKFNIKLSATDKKGYFYVKDDMIISVVPGTEYYSVEKKSI